MALKRFQTDGRLWFWISLVLFVIPWFVPFGDKVLGSGFLPIMCWVGLFVEQSHIYELLVFIGFFCVLFGIPAIAIGWVIQCVVVMIRDAKRMKTPNAA